MKNKNNQSNNHTPMVKQYLSIKSKHPDMLLFYQMGDFYELFYEDAEKVSKLLKITLTKKGYSNNKIIPMAGIPCHKSGYYLSKLIKLGESVVVCDQVADNNYYKKKKLIARKIVRIMTPGTITDEAFLEENEDYFIASIWKEGNQFGYAILDISLGFFGVSKIFCPSDVLAEIERTNPKEIIYPENFTDLFLIKNRNCIRKRSLLEFDLKTSYKLLNVQFNTCNLNGFGINKDDFVIRVAGALLKYVKFMHMNILPNIRYLKYNYIENNIYMNVSTRKSLEITQNISGEKKNTLSIILNKTVTTMGSRMLNRWLNAPLKNIDIIKNRHDSVSHLQYFYQEVQFLLRQVYDVERIYARLCLRTASPYDLLRIRSTLAILPNLQLVLKKIKCKHIKNISAKIGTFKDIFTLLKKSIRLNPSQSIKEGNVIATGYNNKLDDVRSIKKNFKQYIELFEAQEKKKYKLIHLKLSLIESLVIMFKSVNVIFLLFQNIIFSYKH